MKITKINLSAIQITEDENRWILIKWDHQHPNFPEQYHLIWDDAHRDIGHEVIGLPELEERFGHDLIQILDNQK